MVVSLRRVRLPVIGVLVLLIVVILIWLTFLNKQSQFKIGGFIHANDRPEEGQIQPVFNNDVEDDGPERFQRPSKQPALKLKYSLKDFVNDSEQPPHVYTTFQTPDDVIQAYYAILKDASNMAGYHGGCGTIGWTKVPYPYAYELLCRETQQKMSLEEFVDSFASIGHLTLLKLYPAYRPPDSPDNINYHMVEIEVITGPQYKGDGGDKPQPGYFAYYYGLITTEEVPSAGWKIKTVDYIPEDFLCHPIHHWDYEARALIGIIYGNWYGLVDEIEKVEKDDTIFHVYAAGDKGKYRFDFVRLANGDDVLLHEYILQNGEWREAGILKKEHQFYKLSVLSPKFKSRHYCF